MSLDSLLTIAGLLVAAYAIMPEARRLDVRLRFGVAEWLITGLAFFLAVSFHMYEYVADHGYPSARLLKELVTDPDRDAFVVVVLATLLIAFRVVGFRLTPGRMHKFRTLTQELIWSEKYHALSVLLDQHLDDLLRIHAGKTSAIRALVGRCLPTYEEERGPATEVVAQTLTSGAFVKFIARNRPHFGLRIMRQNFPGVYKFTDLYVGTLLADPLSLLYIEIRDNQNLRKGDRYALPKQNRILRAFFEDAQFAHDRYLWDPVRTVVLGELEERSRDLADPYNLPMEQFYENGKWESPLWVGIRFFDIMVSEALYQGVRWHMFVYHFVDITEGICRNCRVGNSQTAGTVEWPNRYCYLLYEIFNALLGWIRRVGEIPAEQENVVIRDPSSPQQNDNIPLSSIVALSFCLGTFLLSPNVPSRFKRYILDMVFELYFELREKARREDYATILLRAVGKFDSYDSSTANEYYTNLMAGYDRSEYSIKHGRLAEEAERILEQYKNEVLNRKSVPE